MNVSVVVTTYKRYDRLGLILEAWLNETANVFLANGGKWFDTTLPIHQHLYSPDPGNKIRFSTAALTTTDFIVLADDDVLPKPGIINDFLKCYNENPGIYGVIGRLPDSDDYFKCSFIRADKIEKPIETFFVGVIYFTHRKTLFFDLRDLKHRAYDDLYWHMVAYRKTHKYVFPTKKYENLKPECNDADSIFKKDKSIRNDFYKMYN